MECILLYFSDGLSCLVICVCTEEELVEAFCTAAEQRFFASSQGPSATSVEFVIPAADVLNISMLENLGFTFANIDFRGFPLREKAGAAIMRLDFPRRRPVERLVERIEQLSECQRQPKMETRHFEVS